MDSNDNGKHHDNDNHQPMEEDEDERSRSPQVPTICSICHNEPPVNAIELNCGHIFCYLCIKSVVETTGACALCRAEIGINFNLIEHPILGVARVPSSPNGQYWFYEGFRGWWLYDAETNREIEEAFQRGENQLEKFVAGYRYVIDLEHLTQQRKDGEGRCRKVCRSTLNLENILGMAGLKGDDFKEILDMMKSAEAQDMMRSNSSRDNNLRS